MGTIILLLIALLLFFVFGVLAVAGKMLGGVFNLFKGFLGGGGQEPSREEETEVPQSEEGAERMKKFKTLAEEADYEECSANSSDVQ